MNANEAPEKLYLHPTAKGNVGASWLTISLTNEDIEYTRTDAFIERALKWYCLDCICNDTCSNTCYFKSTFKKYLEGDDKQLPPKIEDAINPDGSTTENYRYRQFISRMQDAFIERACSWLKESVTNDTECNRIISKKGVITMGELIEDFKEYMEGGI